MHEINSFSGPYRFLSNFYPCAITLDAWEYPSVEHAYQAAKTTNRQERGLIMQAATPGAAKRLGRTATMRPNWDAMKVRAMRYLLVQKFTQPVLGDKLLATGEAWLIEGNSWGDVYWGVCGGRGRNMLGTLLMEIRDQIRTEARILSQQQHSA